MTRGTGNALPSAAACILCLGLLVCTGFAQTTVRLSLAPSYGAGVADGASDHPSLSADGRFVAFSSAATNLVPGDITGRRDVFVRDRLTGVTTRASVSTSGAPADDDCEYPSISADGRFVAFQSGAGNLAPGATGGQRNVYLRDLEARTTVCISVASDGAPATGNSALPSVSANGRYVAFESAATNLVQGDTNGQEDIFVRDTSTNTTVRVTMAADGTQSNSYAYSASISADGRYVAFAAGDGNLVAGDANFSDDVFVRDTVAGQTFLASVGRVGTASDGESYNPVLSADGRHVAFQSTATNLVTGDANGAQDVFVRDLNAGTTVRASVATGGVEAALGGQQPSISADGRYVGFLSPAPDLVPGDTNGVSDAFLRDTVAGTTTRASVAANGSQAEGQTVGTALSSDGRIVAFASDAPNITPGDTNGTRDVFVRDVVAPSTSLISVAAEDRPRPADSDSGGYVSLSGDGRYAAFYSGATNLVPGDTNGTWDAFVRDTWTNTTERVSVATDGTQANGLCSAFGPPSISADGRFVAFMSRATNLVPGDTNGAVDVFVRDRVAHTTTRVNLAWDGAQANSDANLQPYDACALSATGRFVAFTSASSNLVPNDGNNNTDLFLRDTQAATTERVNLTPTGGESTRGLGGTIPSVSADGRYVAFDSLDDLVVPQGPNIVYTHSFIRDRVAGTTTRITGFAADGDPAHTDSGEIQISADGRFVVFWAPAAPVPPLSTPQWGIYVQDLQTNQVTWASRPPGGAYPDEGCISPVISADGRFVAYRSSASNLVPGDTNHFADIFLWDRTTDTIARVNPAADGSQSNRDSDAPGISGDGRFVAFQSGANNLVPGDTNNAVDFFERGPLFVSGPPVTVLDVQAALRIAGGIESADAATFSRLNVVCLESRANAIDMQDVLRLARKALGLDANL